MSTTETSNQPLIRITKLSLLIAESERLATLVSRISSEADAAKTEDAYLSSAISSVENATYWITKLVE